MPIKSRFLSVAVLVAATGIHAVAMSTAFTYQGRLNDAAGPANGHHDFEFRLADAPSNSVPFVSQTAYAVPVSNGLFTAQLDFGSGYFNGDARWLEIAVRVTSSGSNFTPLLPRTPLTPTPYALFADRVGTANTAASAPWSGLTGVPASFADGVDNGADYTAGAGLQLAGTQFSVDFAGGGTSSNPARSDHTHFGQSWLGASTNGGLDVRNTLSFGAGLNGRQGSGSGWAFPVTAGVFGDSSDGDGVVGMSNFRGVWGRATSTNAENYGVSGYSPSTLGHGVRGHAGAKTGSTFGVLGVADSSSGIGIQGLATATNGAAIGVQGRTESSAGFGVYGQATADSGTTYGVLGTADSTSGRGAMGSATALNGTTYGVYGMANSTSGRGVFGVALASTGNTLGVYGVANSTDGVGVRAESPGVALKAAGSGVIQSSAESVLFIPGTAGQFSTDALQAGVGFNPAADGRLAVTKGSLGAAGVHFPILLPAILYGQPVTLESVTIIYACDQGNGANIGRTIVGGMDENGSGLTLTDDLTPHTSKTRTSYTLPLNVKLGSSTAFVNVDVVTTFINGEQGSVTIYGIKAKFSHQ